MAIDSHIGLDGQPCQCTPASRQRATRGCITVCWCHNVTHATCPNAKPCLGKCGRLTTSSETTSCGYCVHCAADARWVPIADDDDDEIRGDAHWSAD